MKSIWARHWFILSCIGIILIATVLRFYQLGNVPHGFAWDEAAIGYNGFAVLTTRRDEWLKKLPISFRSFGDFKAPLAIYLNGFFTFAFGLNIFAVRLPFAIAGVATVLGMILLVKNLLEKTQYKKDASVLGLVAGVLMTFSPWHLQFSRTAFESGLALCFLVWGTFLFSLFLDRLEKDPQGKEKWGSNKEHFLAITSVILLVASLYTYHSAKIVTPLLILLLVVSQWKKIWNRLVVFIPAALTGIILMVPMIINSVYANGNERFNQASVLGLHLSPIELVQTLFSHFIVHFSPSYLLFGQTPTLRHGEGQWGILFPVTLFLVVVAVYVGVRQLLQKKKGNKTAQFPFIVFAIVWVLIGTLPAVIGRDVPHSNRALLALPGFIFLAVAGLRELAQYLYQDKIDQKITGSKGEKQLLMKATLGTLIFIYSACCLAYLHHYYTVFAKNSAPDFEDGYLEAMKIAKEEEKSVDKILVTNSYGQPYIYALFVRKTNPIFYHGGSLIKYEFTDHVRTVDLDRPNTLVIATPEEIDPKRGQHLIYGSDGEVRFVISRSP
jgi:4-amino-4-deoxy-L-arabinose transferase-like glycosyltransferase